MGELAVEMSEVLGITTEKAIEMMPDIRIQFIRYTALNSIIIWAIIVLTVSIILLAVSLAAYLNNSGSLEKTDGAVIKCEKVMTATLKTLMIATMVIVVGNTLKYIVAPEFMLISKLILK